MSYGLHNEGSFLETQAASKATCTEALQYLHFSTLWDPNMSLFIDEKN